MESQSDRIEQLSFTFLEIVEDTGAWYAAVYGVTKNQTRLSN